MPLLKVGEQLLGFVQTAFEASEQATVNSALAAKPCRPRRNLSKAMRPRQNSAPVQPAMVESSRILYMKLTVAGASFG